jgi:formylmethanofuran dehydrogenase subunit E
MMKFLTFIFIIPFLGLSQNPTITVLDTDFSKGRLQNQLTISLEDVAKLHGHLCDGLIVGFLGLKEGLYQLYPDSIIDRTNCRIVSKSSPCVTDVAIYLTGSRYQYNSFYVSDSINYLFIVQRIDNLKTVGIKLKAGIKPAQIDILGKQAIEGTISLCDLDSLKKLEADFGQLMLKSNPKDVFILEEIVDFSWKPILSNDFLKTDVLNKNLKKCLSE